MRLKSADMADQWLDYCRRYSPWTKTAYTYRIRAFLAQCPAYIDQVTIEHIERYLLSVGASNKKNTVNAAACAIKSFYRWLHIRHGCRNLGLFIQTKNTHPTAQRVISPAEYRTVVESDIAAKYKDIFKFLCNTGLRISEFLALDQQCFNGDMMRINGKGDKYRIVPLNAAAMEIVRQYDGPAFAAKYTYWGVRYAFKKIAAVTGIKHFSAHSCRHYTATMLYKSGVPVATIAKILGHSSSAVTEMVYIHAFAEHDLRGVTDCLG